MADKRDFKDSVFDVNSIQDFVIKATFVGKEQS
jgi:hypothetical protein